MSSMFGAPDALLHIGSLMSKVVTNPAEANPIPYFFEWFGELGYFCARVFRAALKPPYEWRELVRQLDEVGSKSALLVLLAGAATGVVIALQTRDSLVRFGAKSSLPAVIILSIITETGPL